MDPTAVDDWMGRMVREIMRGKCISKAEFRTRVEAMDAKNGPGRTNWQAKPKQEKMPERGNVVYFVQGGDGTPIKIGTSVNVRARVSGLQGGNGHRLRLLGWMRGSRVEEQRLHRMFHAERQHGEWFKPSKALLSFIAESCEPPPK